MRFRARTRAAAARPGTPAPGAARWPLWSTYAHLAVADARALPVARSVADELLARVERACSRFRPDSDLSAANWSAGSWVEVDPLLLAAVRAALWAAEVTDGLVDPCLGRALVGLGYDDDLAVVRRRAADTRTSRSPTTSVRPGAWREIEVADDALLVPAGVALDLGASAKAWAADVVARAVADTVGCTTVVSLGGDVRVAGPTDDPAPAWSVRVGEAADDLEDDPHDGPLVAVSGGLATSTTVVRRWRSGGSLQHHLLDPATGRPAAAPYRTVTAGGSTCLGANAATTAAVVLGEQAPQWLAANGVTARIVAQDGSVTTVGDWPSDAPEDRS